MIQKFIERFMNNKSVIKAQFSTSHPRDYFDLIRIVIENIQDKNDKSYESPDPNRIHLIHDDESGIGTQLFVITAKSNACDELYQYWYVKIGYGSCSGCDSLERIRCYSDDAPIQQQIDDYFILCLHIIQKLKLLE